MNLRKRKIYFLGAVAIFIIATPLLILYSTGFRFDFKTFSFAKTGGIFISSDPKGVDIYINGELAEKTSTNIFSQGGLVSGLKANKYTVVIKKNNYRDWGKKLTVNENLVTEARNIFLVPEKLREEVIADNINDFVFSDSQSMIAYAAENTVNITRLTSGNIEQVVFDKKERIGRISFLGDDYLIIESLAQNKLKKYLYNIASKEIIPLKENTGEKYIKIERAPGEKLKLIALSNQNILYVVDAGSQNEQEIIAKDVSNFEIFGTMMIYVTTAPVVLYEKDLTSGKTEQLIKAPIDGVSIASQLLRSKDGNRAIIDNKQRLYLYNNETGLFDLVASDIISAKFSPDGKKLMYQNTKEIFVYYLKDIRIQPYKNKSDMELVTRFSKPITHSEWFAYDNEHIIFAAEKLIKFTELDSRDQRNTYDIAVINNALKIKYNSYDDYLYFLDGSIFKKITLLIQ